MESSFPWVAFHSWGVGFPLAIPLSTVGKDFYKAGNTASSLTGDATGVCGLARDLKERCFIFGNICKAKNNKKAGTSRQQPVKKLLRHLPAHPDIVDHDKAVIDHCFDLGKHRIDFFRRVDYIDDDREIQ